MRGQNESPFDPNGESEKEPNPFQRGGQHFRSKTVSGLIELLPVMISIIVIVYIINFVDDLIKPLLEFLASRGLEFPGMDAVSAFPGTGLILSIIVFYIVGIVCSMKWGRNGLMWILEMFARIPILSGIFGVTKQVSSMLTSQFNFSRVVFLEWPREGMIAMGFVTARVQARGREKSLAIVYIPTIPNPTSGNMAVVVEDDLLETDLSVEDAMKLIFSGGIVPPEKLSMARVPGDRGNIEPDFLGQFETDSRRDGDTP